MTTKISEVKLPSIDELVKGVANGTTTAVEAAGMCFSRIDEEDATIHAYLSLDREGALKRAAEIDAKAAAGEAVPVLAGVPMGVKDVLVIDGQPATAGSKILEGYWPPYTATAVQRLIDAGAVLLGKLNCDEFAMGSSNENSAYGPVRNPHDTERVPGGSSGGSAAAVAAGMAVATLGTDTGGSIRQPASFCGVVGVLPTYGRVSRYGLIAFASSLDRVGPFAATARDAAKVLGVIAGHDPMDATSSTEPVPDYLAEIDKGVRGLRLGVPPEYFGEGLDPEVREAGRNHNRTAERSRRGDRSGFVAPHALRRSNLLRDCDRRGKCQPGALRRRALRISRAEYTHAFRDVSLLARGRLWRRGEAAHPSRDVRAECRLL